MDQEILRGILFEIMAYIEGINNYSYYDLEEYAYSQKQEWISAFENKRTRSVIAEYLKSKKRMSKATYKTPRHEAMIRSAEAKYQYAAQREKDFLAQFDAVEDSIEPAEKTE